MEMRLDEFFPANEAKFNEIFATEEFGYAYLFKLRWPDGFWCPRCGEKQHRISAQGLLICSECEYNRSLTAGTIFHSTKKPLKLWFKALRCVTTRKSGVSAAPSMASGLAAINLSL